MTATILKLAMSKASELHEAAQLKIGREVLGHIKALARLRAELQIGIDELDAGLDRELDIDALIREAHAEHAKG